MPVIIHTPASDLVHEDAAARLLDANGALTLEGTVLLAFLESVDFDEVLDDAELAEFVEAVAVKGKIDAETEDVVEDAESGDDLTVEVMEGAYAAEFVDETDLVGMFDYYIDHLPESTVEEKVLKAAGQRLLGKIDEEDEIVEAAKEGDAGAVRLDEAKGRFAKGDFVKIRKGKKKTSLGKTGKDLVVQMMLAMMHKGAIKRAHGKGAYKAPGATVNDWKKDSGYGEGTPAGQKKVAKYKMAKAGQQAKNKKKVKGAAGAQMKAKTKEAAAKTKAKASALQKKKPGKVTTGKKSLVAHDADIRTDRMDEGLALTHAISTGMNKYKNLKG